MAVIKYALTAFAAIGAVSAASCSNSATTTVSNAAAASSIAACSTYSGSVAVATGAAGDISFSGQLEKVTGDLLVVKARNVTSIEATNLREIGGQFRLEDAVGLFTLTIPLLSESGSIYFSGLSSLTQLDGMTNISKTGSLVIQNTKLSSLAGFNLVSVSGLDINNNLQLQNVSIPLKSIPGAISLANNGERVAVSFPNLETAESLTFRDCASISLPKLETVNGTVSFDGNANLANLSCPRLTSSEGLTVNNNTNLANISFPQLTTVTGALDVQKNNDLGSVSFPKVVNIRGSFDAYGAFTRVSLPALKTVVGAFNLQTSKTLTPSNTCDSFHQDKDDGVIKGPFQCADQQAHPSNAAHTPTGSGAQTVRTSSPAESFNAPIVYTGLFGVLTAMFGML